MTDPRPSRSDLAQMLADHAARCAALHLLAIAAAERGSDVDAERGLMQLAEDVLHDADALTAAFESFATATPAAA